VNSLKTLIVVAVMGVVAYGVYATLTKAPPAPEGEDQAFAPHIEMPADAAAAPSAAAPASVEGFAPKFEPAPPAADAAAADVPPPAAAVPEGKDGGSTVPEPTVTAEVPAPVGTDAAPAAGFALAEDAGGADTHVQSTSAVTETTTPPDAAASASAVNGEFVTAMAAVQQLLEQGELAEGLRKLTEWYDNRTLTPVEQAEVLELLDQLAGTVVYSRQHLMAPAHVLQPGETLEQVALRYSVPGSLLAKINGVGDPATLRPGAELKVMQGPFDALVDVPKHRLTLFVDGCYAGRFQVGLGPEKNTPAGQFEVHNKLENPPYYGADGREIAADDPANPLGEYWVDLGNSLGIHGTIDPETIGGDAAEGCVRLAPADVQHVYDILSIGSRVLIRR
jgi:lipoprotein-anchoring transpeptidase ErfK/SrfK